MVEDDKKILQLTEILREAAKPKKIILFGSQSQGEADARSDVDILIALKPTSRIG